MARWNDVAKGPKARHVVAFTDLAGNEVPGGVALVPLGPGEDLRVAARTVAFAIRESDLAAKEAGIDPKSMPVPKPGDPVYERLLMYHTVLATALDPDSPEHRPEPFFESVQQMLETGDPDRIAVLFYQQREWQLKVSPAARDFDDPLEMIRQLQALSSDEVPELPFDVLPWRTRRTYLRLWASMLLGLPALKLLSGSGPLDELLNSSSTSTSSVEQASSASPSPDHPPAVPPAAEPASANEGR